MNFALNIKIIIGYYQKKINEISITLEKHKNQQYELEQTRQTLCKKAKHPLKRKRENGLYGELYYYCSKCELEHERK